MSSLRPSADFPGLHINGGSQYAAPTAEYVCHCGAEAHANGDTNVKRLVDDYNAHKATHARERGAR
jgi:hypothetical protein